MIPKLNDYKEKWQLPSEDVIKPGLEQIKFALEKLGQPQETLPVIHFAGTNGKGSTLTFVEEIANSHHLTVGKFMSPCIIDVHDQIQINQKPITEKQMDKVFQQMVEAELGGVLTDFELLTCAALLHFHNERVDVVLIETGMGGREDSTNVVTPLVSVITSIALEHTNFLGSTLAQIAAHKAGIIKNSTPVVIGRLPQEAYDVVKKEAGKLCAQLLALGEAFDIEYETYRNLKESITLTPLKRRLLGAHQGENMAIAITAFLEAAKALHVTPNDRAIIEGVYQAQLQGRFEQVLPTVYFDGAHNPASIQALVQTIQEQFPSERVVIVLGMLADKDVAQAIELLKQVASQFIFVDFENSRAMKAAQMREMCDGLVMSVHDVGQYLKETKKVTIVTGSLYLLSELRNL